MSVAMDADMVRMNKTARIFGGILSVVLGVMVLVWPGITVGVIVVLIGIQFVLTGILAIMSVFADDAAGVGEKILFTMFGLLAVLAGVLAFSRPLRSSVLLVVIVGAFWVVGGIVEFLGSLFGSAVDHRGWRIVGGLVTVAAGLVALAWPGITVLALTWITGIWMVVFGIVLFFTGFSRSEPLPAT